MAPSRTVPTSNCSCTGFAQSRTCLTSGQTECVVYCCSGSFRRPLAEVSTGETYALKALSPDLRPVESNTVERGRPREGNAFFHIYQ